MIYAVIRYFDEEDAGYEVVRCFTNKKEAEKCYDLLNDEMCEVLPLEVFNTCTAKTGYHFTIRCEMYLDEDGNFESTTLMLPIFNKINSYEYGDVNVIRVIPELHYPRKRITVSIHRNIWGITKDELTKTIDNLTTELYEIKSLVYEFKEFGVSYGQMEKILNGRTKEMLEG